MSTEEPEKPAEVSAISAYLSQIGRKGGLKGGRARAKRLSPQRRTEIAKKAALTRWREKQT